MMFWLKHLSATVIMAILFNFLAVQILAQGKEQQVEYKPPKGRNQHQTQTRKAGGARRADCNLPPNNTVTLLVPQDHVPTTISERPTFFWYLPQELPLRFTLLEPGKKPIFVTELQPEPGIVALKLPTSSQPLEMGKTYRWTVTVVCSQNKPSKNLYSWALIKRVSQVQKRLLPPVREEPALRVGQTKIGNQQELNAAVDLARSGIWYDALLDAYEQTPELTAFWTLLEQIDLNDIEQHLSKHLN